jgi:hypothetical protein
MASDITLAVGDGSRRMTYAELAQARGISLASARRPARRHHWPRQAGNDGMSASLSPRDICILSLRQCPLSPWNLLCGMPIEQRLGGIYALEGVMNTSEQYHRLVLEALCAFVRDRTHAADTLPKVTKKTPSAAPEQQPAADVQAALTVIGRRDTKNEDPRGRPL